MARDEVDLAYRILDLDLLDGEGRRCGKVDDLELAGEPGETTYVSAVIAGPGAMPARFPRRLRKLGSRLFRGGRTKIGWSEVEDFDAALELRRGAADLGLAAGDRAAAKLFRKDEEDW